MLCSWVIRFGLVMKVWLKFVRLMMLLLMSVLVCVWVSVLFSISVIFGVVSCYCSSSFLMVLLVGCWLVGVLKKFVWFIMWM